MSLKQRIAEEVVARGVSAVCRDLRMQRATVLAFVAGVSHEATAFLVEARDRERSERAAAERAAK